MPMLLTRTILWVFNMLPYITCCVYGLYQSLRARGKPPTALFFGLLALLLVVPFIWPVGGETPGFLLLLMLCCLLPIPLLGVLAAIPARFVLYCVFFGINASIALGLPLMVLNSSPGPLPAYLFWIIVGAYLLLGALLSALSMLVLRTHVLPYMESLMSLSIHHYDMAPAIYCILMLLFYTGQSGPNHLALQTLASAICLCGTYAAYSLSGKLFFQRADNMQMHKRGMYLERCIELQQAQYAALGEQIIQARAARHDFRHHLHVLEQYIQDGNRGRLCEYLPYLRGQIALIQNQPSVCSNSAVDAIARYYLKQAQQAGAQLDVCLHVEEDFSIPGFDLCIVIGNYLENAVEALRGTDQDKRFLRLRAEQVNEMFTLVAANSYQGERLVQNGVFLSTKRPGQEGVGLSSIRAIVQKYAGNCEIQASDGVFRFSLILFAQKEPSHDTDCPMQQRGA